MLQGVFILITNYRLFLTMYKHYALMSYVISFKYIKALYMKRASAFVYNDV